MSATKKDNSMTHGYMMLVDPADPQQLIVWCLCATWHITVHLSPAGIHDPTIQEGMYQYGLHFRERLQIDEPTAHKWIPSSDGLETCEHCDMVRAVC